MGHGGEVVIDDLATIAARIRDRFRRATADIIEIGKDLNVVKARLAHGTFLEWIKVELTINERTARNFMMAAERFGDKSETVAVLPPTALYALASPSTSAELRAETIAALEAGRRVDPQALIERVGQERRLKEKKAQTASRRARRQPVTPATIKRREAKARREEIEFEARRREQAEVVAAIIGELRQHLPREVLRRTCRAFTDFDYDRVFLTELKSVADQLDAEAPQPRAPASRVGRAAKAKAT